MSGIVLGRVKEAKRLGRMLIWRSQGMRAGFAPYLFQCRELLESRQGLGLLRKLDVDGVLLRRKLVLKIELLRFHQGILELFLRVYKSNTECQAAGVPTRTYMTNSSKKTI